MTMYQIIDDANRELPHHIDETIYLSMPASEQVLYRLVEDPIENFIAGDGEPEDNWDTDEDFDEDQLYD